MCDDCLIGFVSVNGGASGLRLRDDTCLPQHTTVHSGGVEN